MGRQGALPLLSLFLLFSFFSALAQQPELSVQTGHANFIVSVAFTRDGRTLASGSVDQTIKLWDTATGRELRALKGHTGTVFGVAFSPDDKVLASSSVDQTIKLWDVDTGREIRTLKG